MTLAETTVTLNEYTMFVLPGLVAFTIAVPMAIIVIAVGFTMTISHDEKADDEQEEEQEEERSARELGEAAQASAPSSPNVSARGARGDRRNGEPADAEIPAVDARVPAEPSGMVGRLPSLADWPFRPDIVGEWRQRIAHPQCPGLNRPEARLDGWYDLDGIDLKGFEHAVWRVEDYDRYVARRATFGKPAETYGEAISRGVRP